MCMNLICIYVRSENLSISSGDFGVKNEDRCAVSSNMNKICAVAVNILRVHAVVYIKPLNICEGGRGRGDCSGIGRPMAPVMTS